MSRMGNLIRLNSLKNQMLVAVSSLVIVSGFLISLLVTERYTRSLLETMTVQAKQVAQAIELDATERILINDLVGLQKTLDQHTHDSSAMSYLFIQRNEQVLAHTFEKGIPVGLLNANDVTPGNKAHIQKITSTSGERYMDIAWPIFTRDAGILRLGFSEEPYRRSVTRLWLQMIGLTLAILMFAMGGTLFFVRRITRPLTSLVDATRKVGNGGLEQKVRVKGQEEVVLLSSSFNQMVARMGDYTKKLEEQTVELKRAHQQTQTFFEIIQEIGSMRSLSKIGSFIIKKISNALRCSEMVILIFNGNRDTIYQLSSKGANALKEPKILQIASASLERMKKIPFSERPLLHPSLVPAHFQSMPRRSIVLFPKDNQPDGALVMACSNDSGCSSKEIDMVSLILDHASSVLKRAVLQEDEFNDLRRRLETPTEFNGIVGKDTKMHMIYKLINDIAPTDATVLVQGENGTGKEVVARAIHNQSLRKDKPFIVINCSAYPAALLESELFGHEKGAFTGAIRQKTGRFEQAHGGTVFLDEIGEISLPGQVKLLRVLQTRKFERLGGEQTMTVDVRILAATNKDLQEEVKKGHFREDLFYRLNVIPITLPPLRERRNDIPLLSHHFLHHFAAEHGKKMENFSPDAMKVLLDHHWPGNVRELRNSIEHAVVIAKEGRIEKSDLPAVLVSSTVPTSPSHQGGLLQTMAAHERTFLQQILEECGWNKKLAANRLGISRNTLYEKLKKHQIISPSSY